jgi:hypothetical protein
LPSSTPGRAETCRDQDGATELHRTLSTHLNGLAGSATTVRAGFVIDVVEEPTPSDLLADQQPLYREDPIFLAARVSRLG